ncbi:SSU ribosomal protein S9P (rps9P) [Archaeoglobus fulgidus DSM 4304]|uniref:Small ribosomal subunit protein uS9 n=2 Tax=Archaeoglobus fulgidus TaxID=2234 RepID=RS9_ARCFU|nr:RecName: Full=Small ribosomal subunit protein uS9; AltName: Full=30S ribosomal protein S9 [Archaeoglobus fulgidus DSM 4304]AAB90113.1 SSU ribosomal protein S9P (rps9P) [Archaeoglobus fulgidus DSM 4304]
MSEMKIVVTSGKRKTATARAVIKPGKGRVRINSVPVEIHQPELARMKIMEPLIIAKELAEKVDIEVKTWGGGFMAQAEAARTAIARALLEFSGDEELRKAFLEYDRTLLVNDVRRKLPKIQGGRGARARRQTSYR